MRKSIVKIASASVAMLMVVSSTAMAESISFNGTVVPKDKHVVYSPIGGTVESVDVSVGQRVNEGDVIARLETTKVYAETSGTITGVFGEPGESADTITATYGAVMFIEDEGKYTISASTANAYNSTDTKFVHVGESVKLSCYSDGKHNGTGVITKVEGTDYTVEVKEGTFLVGETVSIFRGDVKTANRIGRGTVARRNPTAVTGTGSIVSVNVADGDTVKKGDLLFETLTGNFDGLFMTGSEIVADTDGVVAQVNIEQGGKVEKNAAAAVLYSVSEMRIKGSVSEYDLNELNIGDPVSIELVWNQDDDVTYDGVVAMISAVADESSSSSVSGMDASSDSNDVTYSVYIDFTPDEQTRYGMSAVINTFNNDAEESSEEEEVEESEEETEENTEEAQGGFPEGMTPPEGMTLPEGMELPEGVELPEGMQAPEAAEN